RQRRGEVVGLDDEPAGLDDLALDLAELVVGISAGHGSGVRSPPRRRLQAVRQPDRCPAREEPMGAILDINEVRKGNKLDIDGEPYLVVGVDFRKPGKGTPSTVVRMKNMITGSVLERTYKSGEKLNGAD